MSAALVLSLLIHALLLSLTFEGQGFGLPGLGLPWRERRFEVGELRVSLEPTPTMAATSALTDPSTNLMPTGIAKPAPITAPGAVTVMTHPPVDGPQNLASPPIPTPPQMASPPSDTATLVSVPQPVSTLVIAAVPDATNAAAVLPTPRDASDTAQQHIVPEVREQAIELAEFNPAKQEVQEQADQLELAQELAARQKAERLEAAQQAAIQQEAQRVEAARVDTERQLAALQQEAQRAETERLEAERQEAARADAERQEAARQAVARQEAAQLEEQRLQAAQQATTQQEAQRAETARLEAERQEAARQAVARQEAAQLEAQRLQAAQQAATQREAQRAEAARLDAERQQAAQQETAKQDGERQKAARAEQEAKREARLRAIGRQLDEEADRRKAAELAAGASSTLADAASRARRGRLFGRTDPNAELILYAEAWSRKIELNMTFDMVREAAKQRHANPLVTVALRSDGSVESVTIVVSSGVAEIDDAVRRIVQSQAPYPAFPPGLASEYDVIEIRRSWYFDMAVRLY